jgi:hypothetical protein
MYDIYRFRDNVYQCFVGEWAIRTRPLKPLYTLKGLKPGLCPKRPVPPKTPYTHKTGLFPVGGLFTPIPKNTKAEIENHPHPIRLISIILSILSGGGQ